MGTFFGGCLPLTNGRIQSWTLLLSLSFALFSAFTTGNALETTCTASAFESSLQIACNFSKNINTTKSSFCVYHFTSKGTSVVLACNWLDDELSCFTEEGFKIPKQVSNSCITEVEGHVHGNFGCDILPRSDESNFTTCNTGSVEPLGDSQANAKNMSMDAKNNNAVNNGFVEPLGNSQANVKNISIDAKNNSAVNNDPVDCNHWGGPWICSLLFLIILNLMLMLLIFLMKRNKSTEVFKVVLQWCRRPKHKQQKETQYKKSGVCKPCVSTQPNHIGAKRLISVSDKRQTPDENKPLSPHIPEKAPSHQNGSVKQSGPFNDISVSVQRRSPDEKQPWSSFGPEKFRNDMCSASMHNDVHDDMSSSLHDVCSY